MALAMDADKTKALNVAIGQIEKAYGKGAIMRMGVDGPRAKVGAISTSAIHLDAAIGVGGVPRGGITEIFGQSRPARRRSAST
jgi:recombination protein RecA